MLAESGENTRSRRLVKTDLYSLFLVLCGFFLPAGIVMELELKLG